MLRVVGAGQRRQGAAACCRQKGLASSKPPILPSMSERLFSAENLRVTQCSTTRVPLQKAKPQMCRYSVLYLVLGSISWEGFRMRRVGRRTSAKTRKWGRSPKTRRRVGLLSPLTGSPTFPKGTTPVQSPPNTPPVLAAHAGCRRERSSEREGGVRRNNLEGTGSSSGSLQTRGGLTSAPGPERRCGHHRGERSNQGQTSAGLAVRTPRILRIAV